jgi:hypothetical protein
VTLPATPLTVVCPNCGSGAVFYSCDPHCCFNHVCGDCRASFFLTTRLIGDAGPELGAPEAPGAGDSTAPTAPCDRCGGLHVWSLPADDTGSGGDEHTRRGVCADCRALLAVEVTTEAP